MQLRIVGDGTPWGTRVETLDGQLVERIQRVELTLTAVGLPQAVIHVTPQLTLDLVVEAEIVEAQDEHNPNLQRAGDCTA